MATRIRAWVSRAVRRGTRYSISSFLWLALVVAICTLWYRDHQRLLRRIDTATGRNASGWSIDQIVGPPNTKSFGDISTAWASLTPDASVEWVIVEFPRAVRVSALEVYETYNPGAVMEIRGVHANRTEELLWSGRDPLVGVAGGKSAISIASKNRLRRFKIVLDSGAVSGWNELDAVGLKDEQGKVQWVARAWASSSYGFNRDPPTWYWP